MDLPCGLRIFSELTHTYAPTLRELLPLTRGNQATLALFTHSLTVCAALGAGCCECCLACETMAPANSAPAAQESPPTHPGSMR